MSKKLVILAAALLLFASAFALKQTRGPRPGAAGDSGQSAASATGASRTPLPRLVDLGADKCIPCKQMAPILEELAAEHRDELIVEFIDVWKNPDSGRQYGIRLIPTQIFYDATGKERFRHEGFMSKEAILAKWREIGVELGTRTPAAGR